MNPEGRRPPFSTAVVTKRSRVRKAASVQLTRERLDPDPDEGRERPIRHPGRYLFGSRPGVPILLVVGAMPVSILEIDAEILNGLPSQLLRYEPMNRPGQRDGEVENRSQDIGAGSPTLESVER